MLQLIKTRTYRKAKYILYKNTLIRPKDHLWTFVGAFLGIGIIGFIQSLYIDPEINIFLIGSFGASAVLIYGSPNSPLAQPRNLVLGHLLSAFIGVSIAKLIPDPNLNWLACALAVSLSIIMMQMTKSMHPPGGATALIANLGNEQIRSIGFLYIVNPVVSGILILLLIALVVNNIPKGRSYPVNNF